eukprot:3367096-Lingulodinium_polyedra.AAC.1
MLSQRPQGPTSCKKWGVKHLASLPVRNTGSHGAAVKHGAKSWAALAFEPICSRIRRVWAW